METNAPRADGKYLKIEPEEQAALRELLEKEFSSELTLAQSGAWEYGLTFTLAASGAREIFKKLKEDERFGFNMLIDVTAVDWLDSREPRFTVFYHLLNISKKTRLSLKIDAEEDKPEVESLVPLYPTANFLEREVYDMYGITFSDHPDLRRILMYDEFEGYPLRKDYPILKKQPRVKMRIPELRDDSNLMKREELVSLPVRQRYEVVK